MLESGVAVSPLNMVQKAVVKIDLPSLQKLQALADSLSPPAAGPAPAGALAPADPSSAVALADYPPAPGLPRTDVRQAPPATPAPPAKPPAPKPKLTAGSATITLNITNDGRLLSVKPKVSGKDIAFTAGQNAYTVGPVELNTAIAVTPAPAAAQPVAAPKGAPVPEPSVLDQIAQVEVSELNVTAVGSDIRLKQPLVVKDVAHLSDLFAAKPAAAGAAGAGAPSLNAALAATGDVGRAMALVAALQGTPATTTYAGRYTLDQDVSTSGGVLGARGQVQVTDLTLASNGATQFTEHAVQLNNDVALDNAKQSLSINNVSLAMQSSQALALTLKGAVDDFNNRRKLQNITADLSYDAAALWKLVYPMLSKEQQESYKDVKVSGSVKGQQFKVSGEYPANVPFNEAIKTVAASGGLEIQSFSGKGADIQNLKVPFTLSNGVAHVAYPDAAAGQALPPPADFNGGKLALGGASVNLADPHPRLDIPQNTQMVQNVSLNPLFAKTFFANWVNNPLFAGTDKAAGLLNVKIEQCNRFPLDDSLMKQGSDNNGQFKMTMTVGEVQLGSPMLGKLSSLLSALPAMGGKSLGLNSLTGEIANYVVEINNGVLKQDMTMNLLENKRQLRLNGDVNLQSRRMNMTLELPWSTLGLKGSGAEQFTGSSLRVPITGTVDNPNFADLGAIVQKNLVENGLGSVLGNLTGGNKGGGGGLGGLIPGGLVPQGNKDQDRNPTTRSAPPDPLSELGNLLGAEANKKKDKDKNKDKKRKPSQ